MSKEEVIKLAEDVLLQAPGTTYKQFCAGEILPLSKKEFNDLKNAGTQSYRDR